MKRGFLLCFAFLLIFSLSLTSAFSVGEFWNKITGGASGDCSIGWKQCRDFQYDPTCPVGDWCVETCPSPKNFGEQCLSDCQCRPDTTYCDRDPNNPKNYICLRKKVPFQPCTRKEECYSNLCGAGLCDVNPDDACLKYSTESKYMGSPTGCLGREQRDKCYLQQYKYVVVGKGYQTGTICLSKKADGENCVTANECLGNICENWKCNGACIDNDEDDYGLYCEKGDDCNDNDKLINPGMTEVCNLVDDDCNNQINEGFKYNVYYKDKDSDGYGSKDVYENYYFCSEFGDFVVTNHDDCNDNDKLINPSADEICGNEVDENCDGKVKIECPPIVCSDGTFPEECSKNKPGYCTADAKLTADCYKCGCPEGQQCKGSGGGYCMPQCSDGTGLVKCSEKNKGKYCQRQEDESKNVFGELIDDCVACGCPSSVLTLVCNKDTKICEEGCNDEALIGECSIKTASARCSPPNKDIYDPHLSWDCSCCPGGYRCAGEGNFMCIKESCSDGIQNQDETGIDCGGVCPAGCTECLGEPLTSYYEYPDWNIDSSVKDVALEALKEYANYKQVSVDTLDTADEYMEAVSYYLYENGQYMSSHFPNPSDAWIYLNEDSYYAYLDNHKWFGMQNAKLTITESGLRAGCTEKYCGDCDDRSMLYASLLRAIGVNPECVYIATSGVQPGGKSGSSDPVFDHFFNIILYKNKYRIIDVGLPFKNNFFCPKYNIFCWESKYVTKNVYNDKTENTYWEFISALSQTELPGKYTWNYPNSEIKCPADEWKYWTYYADEDKCP